jgi:hypothetical protein
VKTLSYIAYQAAAAHLSTLKIRITKTITVTGGNASGLDPGLDAFGGRR